MKTIGELGLRNFKKDGSGKVIESNKTDIKVATAVDMDTFMNSKPYFTNSKVVPFTAHEFLETTLNMVNRHLPDQQRNFGNVTIYRDQLDIHGYVEKLREGSRFPIITPELPISEIAFKRIITKINLIGDDKYGAAIAIKWEPTKVQVGLGVNVKICDNFNIFGDRLIETNRSTGLEAVMMQVEEHIKALEERYGADLATIQRLAETPVNDKSLRFLIGDLVHKYDEKSQVINLTDVHALSRQIVYKREQGEKTENLWDFTNRGTEILRFDNNSGESILENINSFNNYVGALQLNGKKTSDKAVVQPA